MKRLVLLLLLTASAATAAQPPFGDPSRGQALFVTKGCVQCHAVRGAGGQIGPDLGRSAVKGSFYEIFAAMWNHSATMDEKMRESRLTRPVFTDVEIGDLLAFLYFLNYFDEPGDTRKGRALFVEKHCVECHAIGREGGRTGPRLDDFPRGTPPLYIAQGLWNHGPGMTATMRARRLELPTFKDREIVDLFAWLRSQGKRQSIREFRSAGDPVKGERVFESKGCTRCHAVFGRGGGIGPDLGTTELRGSVTQLAGRMWNHWPAMAGAMEAMGMTRPQFRGEELADLFAWLFITRYDATAATLAAGRDLYIRSGCASCHGTRGEGGAGPALAKSARGQAKHQLAQRMWNHAPQMRDRMKDRMIPWPRFRAEEIAALMRFLGEME